MDISCNYYFILQINLFNYRIVCAGNFFGYRLGDSQEMQLIQLAFSTLYEPADRSSVLRCLREIFKCYKESGTSLRDSRCRAAR